MRAFLITAPAIILAAWLFADTVCAAVASAFRPDAPAPAVERKSKQPPPPLEPMRFAGFGEGYEEADPRTACPEDVRVLSAVASEKWPDATIAAVRLKDEIAVVQRGDTLADAPVERVRVNESGIAEVLLRVNGELVACRAQ